MKKYIYPMALTATLLATAACSDDEVNDIQQVPDSQKEMISFSLSDGTANTRAGFGGSATFIAMRMQSNEKGGSGVKYTRTVATAAKDVTSPTTATSYSEVSFSGAYQRYWDDAHGRKSLLSVFAVAIPNNATDTKGLENKLDKGDESSTWGTSGTNSIAWTVETSAQTKDAANENTAAVTSTSGTIDNEDLVYSNNIQAGGKDGIYRDYSNGSGYVPSKTGDTTHKNGQMLFFQSNMTDDTALSTTVSEAPGKFDKGHLVFNHALTRMTITLVEGEGFDKTSANKDNDFKFADGTNITLKNMNTSGTLNLATGKWTAASTTPVSDITKIAQTSTGTLAADHATEAYRNSKFYTLTAQMLPDYVFADGSTTNVMQFTIDNNTYYITQDQLYDALNITDNQKTDYGYSFTENKFTMQQGKNYNFTIQIDKTKIQNITATLVPWVQVTAKDFGLDNSHVEFTLRDNTSGEACTAGINFYQHTEDLGKIYTDNSYITTDNKGVSFSGDYVTKGAATLTDVSGKWSTNWYFEDNKTAYHFRTISDNAKTTIANGSGTNSYFVMTGGDGTTLPDYHWGAPMKTSANLAYNTASNKGYVENVHEGLTSTHSDILITEMHMLSNLFITLETTTGTDAVTLSGATIKLTKLSNTGNVDMGTGYITPGTVSNEVTMQSPATTDYWQTENVKTKAFQYAVIPQALVRNTSADATDDDYIGITITTSDHNQYYVVRKLSEIYATATTQGSSAYTDPDQKTALESSSDADKTAARITRWYPNHSYHYNIKITKNAIDNITCTVAKWVDVIASDIKIDLES